MCGGAIDVSDIERGVEGPGVFGLAHERTCYPMWRKESARYALGRQDSSRQMR